MRTSRPILLAFVIAGLCAGAAHAATPFKGQIVLTKEALPASFDSDAELARQVKKAKIAAPAKDGDGWTFQFIAFLKQPPGVSQLNLVFYKGKGATEYVNAFDINVSEKGTMVQTSVRGTESDNLKSGETYTLRLARKVEGKEIVYAQTVVKLP